MDASSVPGSAPDYSQHNLNLTDVLFQGLASAVIAVDTNKTVTAFNYPAERMTGLSASAVLRQPFSVLPKAFQSIIEQTFATGKAGTFSQLKFGIGDGGEMVGHASSLVCHNQQNQVQTVIVIFNDLSAARRLETNMLHLDRLANVGTFAAGAAHEIKNALVSVKIFLDLLLEGRQDAQMTELVLREVSRINSIVSRLLKFSSPAKPSLAPRSVHAILENSLRLIQHQLATQRIQMVQTFQAVQDLVDAEEKHLEQAFLNLFLNAMEAIKSNGLLRVTTTLVPAIDHSRLPNNGAAHSCLEVAIEDSGAGIPEDVLPRLFEPFFTTKMNGTGLGLAIAHHIIHQHNGSIEVSSTLNQGATFRVRLPLSSPVRR